MKRAVSVVLAVLALGALVGLGWYLGLTRNWRGDRSEAGRPLSGREPIVIGGLMDTTGPTSDVGRDYAMGMEEAFRYVNDTGGIAGRPVSYVWFDYGYRVQEAVTRYNYLKKLGVIAIMGWGTADTEALARKAAEDGIAYVSASYSARLTDPKTARANFFFAPDYSTSARAALSAWFDARWPQNPAYGKRKPRLACVYQFSSPYAASAVKAVKDHARILTTETNSDWDQDLSLFALDAKKQAEALKKIAPDVVFCGNTTQSVALILREARAAGVSAQFIVNPWGFDENLPALAGPAAEGVMGVTPSGFFAQDFPLMNRVREYARRCNPQTPPEKRLIRTVQAWADALMLAEALKRADAARALSGPGVIRAFETLRSFDIGLGAAPVTFTAADHRPTGTCLIQEWRNGAFSPVERVDVAGRWPQKWRKEWMGW